MQDARNVEIRPANADETTSVVACVNAAYSIYLERMDRPPAPMLADYDALIAEKAVWALPGEERLCGILVMFPRGDHLFLENIAVHPDDQGKGLGRTLMAFVERHARLVLSPSNSIRTR